MWCNEILHRPRFWWPRIQWNINKTKIYIAFRKGEYKLDEISHCTVLIYRMFIWKRERIPGGGGGVLPYVCILGMCRARDPGSASSAAASWQFRRFTFSRSKRLKLVPEPRIFTLKTAQARSGAPHFQAQNGSSSFRSPAFLRFDRELVPEPWQSFHFAAAHTYQHLGWVSPPPRGGGGGSRIFK